LAPDVSTGRFRIPMSKQERDGGDGAIASWNEHSDLVARLARYRTTLAAWPV
jgi:hypothetical protein